MYSNLTAIILRRQDFRDDDLLVTIYSRESGKLTLIARGAKKILSKLAGHLEPVSLSLLNAASGKSLDQLTGASQIKSYAHIKNDLNKTSAATWLLKIIDELTLESHEDERIFHLAEKYLDFLEQKEEDYEIAKLAAGFKLLALLGLDPSAKAELKFRPEIEFIIKNSINKIYKNENIKENFKSLYKILVNEIEK
ncbi:MAG TPA: DNA repair protein RecO [Patescibacteria group bacterium]|nr:DNA repair protein RecO [Patescibacteria group bacterium]